MPPEQVILTLIGTVAILVGCFYVTRLIANKASGQTRIGLKNRNICLLDRYAIARDKQFCVVEIADKVYIIGVTNHTMTLIDTLDAEAFAQFTAENNEAAAMPWNMTPVGQYGNKLTRKLVAFVAEKTGKTGTVKSKDEQDKDEPNITEQENSEQNKENRSKEAGFAESFKEAQKTANDTQKNQSENPEED